LNPAKVAISSVVAKFQILAERSKPPAASNWLSRKMRVNETSRNQQVQTEVLQFQRSRSAMLFQVRGRKDLSIRRKGIRVVIT
jgi:hypothetical protein